MLTVWKNGCGKSENPALSRGCHRWKIITGMINLACGFQVKQIIVSAEWIPGKFQRWQNTV